MKEKKTHSRTIRRISVWGILFVTFFAVLNFNPERRIQRFVLKHQDNLTELAEEYLNGNSLEKQQIKETVETDFHGIQLAGPFPENVVSFYVGGFGLVPSAKYYGFYYSPDDIPVSTGEGKLKPQQDKTDRWSFNGYGDNGGEIIKIKEHWYYYKCWF